MTHAGGKHKGETYFDNIKHFLVIYILLYIKKNVSVKLIKSVN